ncbi:MAG: GntR family transcriptional regulator [Bacteroidota bacterium]
MNSKLNKSYFTFNEYSGESKASQIASAIELAIYNGTLLPGDKLPTVNEGVKLFGAARKTVVKAYKKLIEKGFVESINRRGYFVLHNRSKAKIRVLLLIHSFDPQFQLLYDEFSKSLGDDCEIDLYFHHYNIQVVEMVINRNFDKFDYYLISSFNHSRIPKVISRIPRRKVLIISRNDNISSDYYNITQDFYNGTFSALQSATHLLKKYSKIVLCYPGPKGHSETLKNGFEYFCQEYKLSYSVVESLANEEIQKGKVYFVIEDNDLVKVIKCCKNRNWKLGEDIGLVAYNETPLKEVIRDGISVVSCDFSQMANEMVKFINNGHPVHKIIPIRFIERNSL